MLSPFSGCSIRNAALEISSWLLSSDRYLYLGRRRSDSRVEHVRTCKSGAATTHCTAQLRSGLSVRSNGAASSLWAIATSLCRSSGLGRFSADFSGVAGAAVCGLGGCAPLFCWADAHMHTKTARTKIMRHLRRRGGNSFGAGALIGSSGAFLFIVALLAGIVHEICQLALLLLFQQVVQRFGLGGGLGLENRRVGFQCALHTGDVLSGRVTLFFRVLHDKNGLAESRLVGKLWRVLVLFFDKVHSEQHRRADVHVYIGNILQPLFGPGLVFVQVLVQRTLLQLVGKRDKTSALLRRGRRTFRFVLAGGNNA